MKSLDKLKILVVDDEVDICEIISERFRVFNFNVDTANSGNQAWAKLQQDHYDLVITDIKMEDGDGFELVRRITEELSYRPKIFFISGHVGVEPEEIYEMGAEGLFLKPFDSKMLMDAARRAALTPKMRWETASAYETSDVIKQDFNHIENTGSQLIFGCGGFFIKHPSSHLNIGQRVVFEFNFSEGPVKTLCGAGLIKWVRDREPQIGIGVEIEYLEDKSIHEFIAWLEEQEFKSFIPFKKVA